jgi:hypothetical protein
MTRFQHPDSEEDRRRARRAPLVAALFIAALALAGRAFYSGGGGPPPTVATVASQVVTPIVPDQIPLWASFAHDGAAEDGRAIDGDPERDPRYYDGAVRQ